MERRRRLLLLVLMEWLCLLLLLILVVAAAAWDGGGDPSSMFVGLVRGCTVLWLMPIPPLSSGWGLVGECCGCPVVWVCGWDG